MSLPREVLAEVGHRDCCRTVFPGPHDETVCTRWRPTAVAAVVPVSTELLLDSLGAVREGQRLGSAGNPRPMPAPGAALRGDLLEWRPMHGDDDPDSDTWELVHRG